jgi:hypothetical protein
MVRCSSLVVLMLSSLSSCSSKTPPAQIAARDASDAATETAAKAPAEKSPAGTPAPAEANAKAAPSSAGGGDVVAYLRAHLPKGGSVEAGDPPKLLHAVAAGDTYPSIAAAYLELTEIYTEKALAAAIQKANPNLVAGKTIEIPMPLTRAPRDPKEERLGWPEDKILRGIFLTGPYAQMKWVETLDKMAARGINLVVLDAKDYEGPVNYPTKAKIALETGAAAKPAIPNLARMIRFAHWRGIRVSLRIPCFHDPIADKKLKDSRLSLRFAQGNPPPPIHIDWIEPTNPESQEYVMELAQEGVDAGADEINLDYVRFPVHIGQKTAKLPDPKDRSKIIRDFVRKVHNITKPAGAALSLDIFGVAATGTKDDIDRLGQEIAVIGPEAEAIAPMTYPSHYSKGYMGWDEPGDHPEIVGIGTKAAVKQLKAVNAQTVVRSWVQAFAWHTNIYGSKYVVDQAKSAEQNGGHGWLMWSPACEYSAVWNGFPPKETPKNAVAAAPPASASTTKKQ